MKLVKAIWIAVVLLSLAAGLWQLENIQLIWREYSSLYRHVIYKDHSQKLRGPFISPEAAKQDPEVAAVAEAWLLMTEGDPKERVETVADKLLTYPDNKFLLVELVRNLRWDNSVVDPQISLRCVDKLIALEPNNANYHYMKCSLLLTDRQENDINAALQELEYANNCSNYAFPYTGYRQRATDLARKAKVARFLMPHLTCYFYGSATFDIWERLIAQANVAFSDGNINDGMRITNALAKMQLRQFRDGDFSAICSTNLSFTSGAQYFGYWRQPQQLELQRVNLTKERAKEDRLQLCALMRTSTNTPEENKRNFKQDMDRQTEKLLTFIAVPPAVHSGEMFIASLWVCAILLLICMIRGLGEKNKIGLWGILVFVLACAYYFFIVKGVFLISLYNCSCCHSSYTEVFRPPPYFINFAVDTLEDMIFAGLFLLGPILAALILWGAGFIRPKEGQFWRFWYIKVILALAMGVVAAILAWYMRSCEEFWPKYAIIGAVVSVLAFVIVTFAWWISKWRITKLFLITTFLGFFTLLFSGYRYVRFLPMIVFVLTAAVVAIVKPGEGTAFKTVLRFFSSKPDIAAIRNKCFRLTAPFIVVYWLIFAALAPWVVKSINLGLEEYGAIVERKVTVPDPNQAYHELVGILDANSPDKWMVARLIGIVMPEDLPDLLQKLKNKEFGDYNRYRFLPPDANEQEKARWEKQEELARRLNDNDLAGMLLCSGKDTVGIITGFMDDPNADRALVARAKLGDSTAKEKLEQVLQIRMQSEFSGKQYEQTDPNNPYASSPVKTADMIAALACISKPDSAVQYFLDYVRNRDIYDLTSNDSYFFMGLSFLPAPQSRTVIKAYLDKASNEQPPAEERNRYRLDNVLHRLDKIVGLYGDEQIAQGTFKIMLRASEEEHYYFKSYEISPYFTIESAPLLKQGLESKNSDMRAWCVWQLRKIGYKFDNAELEKLMKDESWKVRANAAFAGGKEVAPLAAKDKNALVRLIANFN